MSAEVKSIRNLTQSVKFKALKQAKEVLDHPEKFSKEMYEQTYLTVLKNSVPREQYISGDPENQTAIPITILQGITQNGIPSNTSPQESPSS